MIRCHSIQYNKLTEPQFEKTFVGTNLAPKLYSIRSVVKPRRSVITYLLTSRGRLYKTLNYYLTTPKVVKW